MSDFNLVEQAWVPVLDADGPREVSLREALVRAHEIRALTVEDPLETAAVLRQVLLPVVMQALEPWRSAARWRELWRAPRFPTDEVEEYLSGVSSRFDLFDEHEPFAQTPGLRTDRGEEKPASLLVAHVPTGNNAPLFGVRTEADPVSLSPAQAARALLACLCWDTAAIKSGAQGDPRAAGGKTTGNHTGPCGQLGLIVPMGATLKETLLLNIVVGERAGRGQVPWGLPVPGPAWRTRLAAGPVEVMTWPARRVRLVSEIDEGGRTVVRRVVLCAGDRLDDTDPEVEWHSAWLRADPARATARRLDETTAPPKAARPQYPLRHRPGRSAWQGLQSLLPLRAREELRVQPARVMEHLAERRALGDLPDDVRLQILTVGVAYGNKAAVIEHVMSDLIPMPMAALEDGETRDLLLDCVDQAEALARAVDRLQDHLRLACGAAPEDRELGSPARVELTHRLGTAVRRLLAGLSRDPALVEQARSAWTEHARREAHQISERLLDQAAPAAFAGLLMNRDKLTGRRSHSADSSALLVRVNVAYAERQFAWTLDRVLGPRERTDTPADA